MGLPSIGDKEHLALKAVWRLGRCTVREVFAEIGEPQGLAYTTTATVLDRLFAKGLLSRHLEGKAFVYRPARKEGTFDRARVKALLSKALGPDPLPAVVTLVDALEAIDPDLLDPLGAEIAARRKARRGS